MALVPDGVRELRAAGLAVLVESGAGAAAFFADDTYAVAGAELVTASQVYDRANVTVTVGRPTERLHSGQMVLGLLAAAGDPPYVRRLAEAGVTAVSFEGLPRRLSRVQPMDALTSQANVAGYKAVLVAAGAYGGYFPMLVTAAGTVRPTRVLVLGAGVAGLQAMATARRLGAVVSAYNIRPESRDEVLSVSVVLTHGGRTTHEGTPS